MFTSSHNKWPWSTWYVPKRNLSSKSISFVLYQRRVAIKNLSNTSKKRNLEALDTNSKRKLILKSNNFWSLSKASHSKWPCLPLATISDLEALDTFQKKICFQNLYPLFCIKNESPWRTCLTLKIKSNLEALDTNLMIKTDFKIKQTLVCIKG